MIVVDTNVLTYLLLEGQYVAECRELFKAEENWAAPSLWRFELTNIIATYERVSGMKRAQSLTAFDNAISIIADREYDIPVEHVLDCSARTGLSGYDATYVALAEGLKVTLYTYDKSILKACPKLAQRP